jgi:hypothetical protein
VDGAHPWIYTFFLKPDHVVVNILRTDIMIDSGIRNIPDCVLAPSKIQIYIYIYMSSEKYVNAAVANVTEKFGKVLPKRCRPFRTPMVLQFRPENNVSEDLEKEDITYYQELIGVLRWAAELGCIDIACEMSMLSSHMALPRRGHLEQIYHIFGYLYAHPKHSLYFNPEDVRHPDEKFVHHDWKDFYRDAKEAVPDDMPEPQGVEISIIVLSMPIMQLIKLQEDRKLEYLY